MYIQVLTLKLNEQDREEANRFYENAVLGLAEHDGFISDTCLTRPGHSCILRRPDAADTTGGADGPALAWQPAPASKPQVTTLRRLHSQRGDPRPRASRRSPRCAVSFRAW